VVGLVVSVRFSRLAKSKKDMERRKTQGRNLRALGAALSRGRQLAFRRSTTALPKGCVVPWCDPGQVSWANRPKGGGHSADDLTTSSDAPRMPVIMAADMPGPPGSGLQARPRAPPLAPAAICLRGGVLYGRDDLCGCVTEIGTNVMAMSPY
jgi:hypothetical protein